jgi:hypothetical protein
VAGVASVERNTPGCPPLPRRTVLAICVALIYLDTGNWGFDARKNLSSQHSAFGIGFRPWTAEC